MGELFRRPRRGRESGGGARSEPPDVRRAVERLAEDEALRGDLADAGFGPLLATVAGLALARAGRYADTDSLYLSLRRLLRGAVEAAAEADPAPLLDAALPPLIAPAERAALAARLTSLTGPADAAAAAIAAALGAAVPPTPPPQPPG